MNDVQIKQRMQELLKDAQPSGLVAISILLGTVASALFLLPTSNVKVTDINDAVAYSLITLIFLVWLIRHKYPLGIWVTILGISLIIIIVQVTRPDLNMAFALVIPCIIAAGYLTLRDSILYCLAFSFTILLAYSPILSLSTHPLLTSLAVIWGSQIAVWVILRPYRTVTVESWMYYSQARELLSKYRDNQQDLVQMNHDLKQAYAELARLNKVVITSQKIAEEARQAKESFVANVSHELRTPLNMIIGFSDMISRSPQMYHRKLPAELLADISAIRRNAEHLSRLVDDVLDLSKLDTGYFRLNLTFCSVNELILSAMEGVRSLFELKGLYLKIDKNERLPQIICDETRIRQVLLNLLSNAGRFVDEGGVTISTSTENGRVVISVSDTGPGITDEEQRELFEPFHQLDKPYQSHKGGTGLGLSISKRLVELHDGQIWLTSQEGIGTTFYFSLPLTAHSEHETGVKRWFSPFIEYNKKDRDHRKQIVDDFKNCFLFIDPEGSLSKMASRIWDNIDVEVAESFQAAEFRMANAPPQALIINQPDDLVREDLRKCVSSLSFDIPIFLCDAKEPSLISERFGVNKFLVKPVTRERLLNTVTEIPREIHKILIVDDETECLQLFSRMLNSAEKDYQLFRAENGERALSMIRKYRPDLIIMDLIMPGLNGLELLPILRQDPKSQDIPIIITSAQDPHNEPLSSTHLTLIRKDGFSGQHLLDAILNITRISGEE